MPFSFHRLEMPELVLVTPRVFPDERGFFLEAYKESEFAANGITAHFVQDNHSCSSKGVVRGLHFQRAPKAQAKLVRVVRGAVWDVAVDLRAGSATYRKWLGVELTEDNHAMLFIPAGFAHGFVALADDTHLLYKCSAEYDAKLDGGIRWDDPRIGVSWPVERPIVSAKDGALPSVEHIGEGL